MWAKSEDQFLEEMPGLNPVQFVEALKSPLLGSACNILLFPDQTGSQRKLLLLPKDLSILILPSLRMVRSRLPPSPPSPRKCAEHDPNAHRSLAFHFFLLSLLSSPPREPRLSSGPYALQPGPVCALVSPAAWPVPPPRFTVTPQRSSGSLVALLPILSLPQRQPQNPRQRSHP